MNKPGKVEIYRGVEIHEDPKPYEHNKVAWALYWMNGTAKQLARTPAEAKAAIDKSLDPKPSDDEEEDKDKEEKD